MRNIIWSFALSFALTALSGLFLLPALRKLKFGQSIREDGPHWHMGKSGTPTMGGLMFILGVTVCTAALGWPLMSQGQITHLLILAFAWIYGGIGFLDDFFKVSKHRNLGLSALSKLILQLTSATALLTLILHLGYSSASISIPSIGVDIPLPLLVFLIPAVIYTTGFVNAVNLTDGIDGLCSGVTLPVTLFFAVLCAHREQTGAALCAAALAGGVAGFLLYNFHPARVFMGDTGSLFLGGALCGLAFAARTPLLLVPVGFFYLLEMFSVIAQVLYFKATHGRRLFRMSPIHHHFEMGGWSEKRIFYVFTLLTLVVCSFMLWLEWSIK